MERGREEGGYLRQGAGLLSGRKLMNSYKSHRVRMVACSRDVESFRGRVED